jgi:hypothetical protein
MRKRAAFAVGLVLLASSSAIAAERTVTLAVQNILRGVSSHRPR